MIPTSIMSWSPSYQVLLQCFQVPLEVPHTQMSQIWGLKNMSVGINKQINDHTVKGGFLE